MNIIGKIIGIKEEKEYYDKYILKIIKNQKYRKTESQKIIIYVENGIEFIPGDIVSIEGIFEKSEDSRNYKGFNYKRYLLQNKFFGNVKCEYVKKVGNQKNIYTNILMLRGMLCSRVDKIFDENVAEFLNGLLFGKIDRISEFVKDNFEISNISHILAISGMHVIYVLIGIKFIINKFIKNKKIKNIMLIHFLFFFYILTGLAVSCLRACIMSAMSLFASIIYRKNNFYISFIISLLIILLINPYNLYNIGMWLSYFGTLGIIMFYEFFKRFFEYYNARVLKTNVEIKNKNIIADENKKYFCVFFINIKNKILSYVFENFILSISAQILIFPIMIYAFNTISFTFFIPNILVSIFIAPTLILGYFSVFLSYLPIPIYKLIIILEESFVNIIIKIGEICSKIPFSRIYVPTPNFICIVVYYIVILALAIYFNKRKYYSLKLILSISFLKMEIKRVIKYIVFKVNKIAKNININNSNNDNNNNNIVRKNNVNIEMIIYKNKVIFAIINVLCSIFILSFILISRELPLKIYFIDVGQGDCTVIQTPNNKNIIIDGGEGNTDKYDYGENVVLPYLLDRGITKIDYLIISHCDSDHIGGLFAVLENLKVENVFIGVQPEVSEQFNDLIRIANKKKIKIKFLSAGDFLKLEDNVKIEILWPVEGEFVEENTLNNNSLVFKLYYKEFSILFTGDIEEVAEKEIINRYNNKKLNASILKIAHHGSKTSTTKKFLEKVNPKIALIGVGEDNKFGHPSEEILKLLNYFNVKVYRTDINGEIVIKVKDNKIDVSLNFQ